MRITGGKRAVASAALVAATAPGLAFAEDTFRAEAGASYSRTKGDDFRRTTAGADGTYYFDNLPSRPKETPYDQVQFVEHVGSVTAFSDWTSSDRDDVERVSNGYDYGATLQLARPDTFLRIGAAAEVLKGGKTRSGGVETETDAKAYQLSIGGYLARTTSVDLNWSRSNNTTSSSVGLPDIIVDGIGLTGQHLASLPGGSHVALSATAMQFTFRGGGMTEKNKDLLLQAIYYPTQVLGLKLGVRIDRGDVDSLEGETYIAGLKTYVTPAISLSVDYQKFNAKAAGFDFDTVMLRAAMRF